MDAKTGVITTLSGLRWTNDTGSALLAGLQYPSALLFGRAGELYFVGAGCRVYLLDLATREIKTIAGSREGFGGDGGPAVAARLNNPSAIALDAEGNLYLADYVNHRIRRVDARTGTITTIAGNGLPSHPHLMM